MTSCGCGCGKVVKTRGRFYSPGHNPNQQTASAHRKQALAITGNNNPAKRLEVREKLSRGLRENHPCRLHPEQWVEHARYMRKQGHKKVSALEDKAAFSFPEFQRQYLIGKYRFDFVHLGSKKILEVNGCWHHACPACHPEGAVTAMQKNNVRNDLKKKNFAEQEGYTIFILWEHQIKESK